MRADWKQNPIAPGRRKRPWRGVTIFDWVTEVPGVDHGGAQVYGCIVEGAGNTSVCRNVSLPRMAERLHRSEPWVRDRLTQLTEAHLVRREAPKGDENALRWQLLQHPMVPGFFHNGYDVESVAIATSETALDLWFMHAQELQDDEDVLGGRFYYLVRDGDRGGDLLLEQVRSFLAKPRPLTESGRALPAFETFTGQVDWAAREPRAWVFHLGWRAYVAEQKHLDMVNGALAQRYDSALHWHRGTLAAAEHQAQAQEQERAE